MNDLKQQLTRILSSIYDEFLEADLISAKVATVSEDGHVSLTYPYPAASQAKKAKQVLQQKTEEAGINCPNVTINFEILKRMTHGGTSSIPNVKNIIAVFSTKGGVGKSTIAANFATSLASEGAKTGLLDIDIYGPSVPELFPVTDKPEVTEQGEFIPYSLHGIKVMSMGYLIDRDQPIIWRGPMVGKAIDQLLHSTKWDDLDFLVLDLPPGTGDIQLSLAQKTPLTTALLVSTPQNLAYTDTIRGINMFKKLSVPIIGFVENMAYFTCNNCNTNHRIYGSTESATKLEQEYKISLLAELPISLQLNSNSPIVRLPAPDFEAETIITKFNSLANRIGALIANYPADRSDKFPKVVPATK